MFHPFEIAQVFFDHDKCGWQQSPQRDFAEKSSRFTTAASKLVSVFGPLMEAFCFLAIMDIRAHPISFETRP